MPVIFVRAMNLDIDPEIGNRQISDQRDMERAAKRRAIITCFCVLAQYSASIVERRHGPTLVHRFPFADSTLEIVLEQRERIGPRNGGCQASQQGDDQERSQYPVWPRYRPWSSLIADRCLGIPHFVTPHAPRSFLGLIQSMGMDSHSRPTLLREE